MNKEHAHLLLKNLLDRMGGEDRPRLTDLEGEAINLLLGLEHNGNDIPDFGQADPLPKNGQKQPNVDQFIPLKLDGFDDEPVADLLMCLDFGTSFSKAFAIQDQVSGPMLIDLPIGQGEVGRERFFAAADILIDEGKVFFGTNAAERVGTNSIDRLIQSPKQLFTMSEDATTLRNETLNDRQDPAQLFSIRDIIVLYLSYLNFVAERELSKSAQSLNVSRRFTHPAWKKDFRERNKDEMSTMMAEAIILSRNLSDRLVSGLDATVAASMLKQVRALEPEQLPTQLVAGSVREATAAGAGALLETDVGVRQGYLIVDVGAGTTDIAGFVVIHRSDTGELKVVEIEEAAVAIRWAGNLLDQYLSKFILLKAGFSDGSAEAQALENRLRKERRSVKETLFNEQSAIISLPNDTDLKVDLDEFLATNEVRGFSEKLQVTVAQAFDAMGMFANKLLIVATGGGASLPMVQDLSKIAINTSLHGKIVLKRRAAMSEALAAEYPELEDVYPQLAVAIGGALPELPEERSINSAPGEDRGPLVIAPNYR